MIPFESGWPVEATVLVLSDAVTQTQATDMLYRRERHREGSSERYRPPKGGSLNAVTVKTCDGLAIADVETVLYTHLASNIEPSLLSAAYLAERAIWSVSKAAPQMDGISYLIGVRSIQTPLRGAYEQEILLRTATSSLEEALRSLGPPLASPGVPRFPQRSRKAIAHNASLVTVQQAHLYCRVRPR